MKPLKVDMFQVFSILSNQLKSISKFSAAQNVTLPTCFSHPSLGIGSLLFGNPTHKTETGTANKQVRRGVLIANHLDQSLLWWANQKRRKHCAAAVRSYFIIGISAGGTEQGPCTCYEPPLQSVQFCRSKKPYFAPKPACFDFSSFNFFYCADHLILSTTGDALTLWNSFSLLLENIHTC
jgi:hypothetical protein